MTIIKSDGSLKLSKSDSSLNITRDTLLTISRDPSIEWGSTNRRRSLDGQDGVSTLTPDTHTIEAGTSVATNKKYVKRNSYQRKISTGSAASSHRYDLDESTRRMKESTRRIKDIHDLVDDDFDDSLADESEIVGTEFRIGQHKLCWKYTALLVSVMGIIGGASIAIGYTVKNSSISLNNNSKNTGEKIAGEDAAPKELIDLVEQTNLKKSTQPVYSVANTGDEMGREQQKLLEMAERIVLACSEDQLATDMSQCDFLCWPARCCFDGTCNDDVHMHCAAYAGCQALVY